MHRREAITAVLGLTAVETTGASEATRGKADSPASNPRAAGLTPQEHAAGIGFVNPIFLPGDVRRYGAEGHGRSDDSAAWSAAILTGHRVLGGGAECVYLLRTRVPIGRSAVIDLQSATVKPIGHTQAFVRDTPSPTAIGAVTGGAEQGSRTVRLKSSTGFTVGQWVRLSLNDYPRHDASSYPPAWARIVAVRSDAIDVDTPLQLTYPGGQLRALAYDPGVLYPRFECRNGIFDGSECTFELDTGQGLRISGFERVLVHGCEFRNFANDGKLTCPVEIFAVVDADVSECRFTGGVSRFDTCDIQEARFAHFVNNTMDGSHFGCNLTRVDYGLVANNSLHGQRSREAAESPDPLRSVRGIKAYGCAAIRVLGNHIGDFESPIKVEACFRYDVSHNVIFNAGLSPFTGQIALNVGSIIAGTNMRGGRIVGNHVEHCGGIGIGVTSDPPGGVVIAANIVRATQAAGMHISVAHATITGNRIEDWGLRDRGDPAIWFGASSTVADNRFSNAALRDAPCLVRQHRDDPQQVLRDNVSETGNPLLASTLG
ncbi:MAG: hypothetical protein ACREVV_14680 [Steroidobacteraceae bacterium]